MKPLRVLHVNASDKSGGAARAAYRIHLAQRQAGLDSHMLVLHRSDDEPHIQTFRPNGGKIAQHLRQAISVRLMARQHSAGNPTLHSLNRFGTGLADWINRSDFDVVNLHWLGSEMVSIEEIGRIRKPLVWTLHDMWAFCGAEHYDDLEHPGRYRLGYRPDTRPPGHSGPDLDAQTWRRKQRAWAKLRLHLVSPSRWLAGCAAESVLLGHQPCTVLPNGVDTAVFKPVDRRLARGILNLDPAKRYVLFGAVSSTTDRRKGFHLLQAALQQLAAQPNIRQDTELLVFGAYPPSRPPDLGLPTHYLGHFHDDASLALLYSAADVFAAPSLQDNLPNTVVESLTCGTPVVAFDVGGMPDLIENGHSGFLAAPFQTESFARHLSGALQTPLPREPIAFRAQSRYGAKPVAEAYGAIQKKAVADGSPA